MTEIGVIDTYLTTMLADISGSSGVYSDIIPQDSPLPATVFNLQSSKDSAEVGAFRILTDALYQIKVIGHNEHGNAAVDAIAAAIDAVLDKSSGDVSGGRVLSCVRERPIAFTEVTKDKAFRHRGGLYRIQAQVLREDS